MGKRRLDLLLVERGLFPTRSKAQAALQARQVEVAGHPDPKPSLMVPPDVGLKVVAEAAYVSRGGLKLEAALEAFQVDPSGRVAMDVGACTGGFTDCLLRRGARRVYAIDVGHGQLDARLRADPRVVSMEKTNARTVTPSLFPVAPDLAAIDVSFISLSLVLPAVAVCLHPPREIIALIKPQFELDARKVNKGVVRKEEHRRAAIERARAAAEGLGFAEKGLLESPIRGSEGNIEYLALFAASA